MATTYEGALTEAGVTLTDLSDETVALLSAALAAGGTGTDVTGGSIDRDDLDGLAFAEFSGAGEINLRKMTKDQAEDLELLNFTGAATDIVISNKYDGAIVLDTGATGATLKKLGNGDVTIDALGTGADSIKIGSGDDSIQLMGGGKDSVSSGGGDDNVTVDAAADGTDIKTAGGADEIEVNIATADMTIHGGGGRDTLDLSGVGATIAGIEKEGGAIEITLTGGTVITAKGIETFVFEDTEITIKDLRADLKDGDGEDAGYLGSLSDNDGVVG